LAGVDASATCNPVVAGEVSWCYIEVTNFTPDDHYLFLWAFKDDKLQYSQVSQNPIKVQIRNNEECGSEGI
jgi:hypothetical protein